MTTTEIATEANRDSLATADIDLQTILRYKVIPQFFRDVGYVSWRRSDNTASLSIGTKHFDITANDLDHFKVLTLAPDFDAPLSNIGDAADLRQRAIYNTTNAKPTAYFLTFNSTGFIRVYLNCPCDAAYTAYYTYDRIIRFTDTSTVVNLDLYIPYQHQWALIPALRAEVYERRHGIGDSRYQMAMQEYQMWIARATENPEMARSGTAKFAR